MVRDQELLARLRTLGSKARAGAPVPQGAGEDAVSLLGLSEPELTTAVRSLLSHL